MKKQRKMTHSIRSKITAYVLIALAVSVCIICGAAIYGMWSIGVYDSSRQELKEDAFRDLAVSDGQSLLSDLYRTGGNVNLAAADEHAFHSNCEYRVLDKDGEAWKSDDFDSGDPIYGFYLRYRDDGFTFSFAGYSSYGSVAADENDRFVEIKLTSLSVHDRYRQLDRLISFFYSTRYLVYIIFVPFAALAVACFVFLMCSAGRREGRDELAGGYLYHVPFDVMSIMTAAVILGGAYLIGNIYSESLFGGVLAAVFAVAASLLLTGWSVSLSARVKLGGWWKNTVIYMVLYGIFKALAFVLRGVARAVRGVPLVWKTVLALFIISLFDFLCIAWGRTIVSTWVVLRAAVCVLAVIFSVNLKKLQKGGEAIAAGQLDHRVDTAGMFYDAKKHAMDLNSISMGVSKAVEERVKSERLKTELITNVSHDIKTPLTSIINYVDILCRDRDPEHVSEYLSILDRQTKRLKKLTEDLVELSKASTGNVEVSLSRHSISEILRQAVGEYSERLEKSRLEPVLNLPEDELFALADGTLTWRILDNLLSNAQKYALGGTRLYIEAFAVGSRVRIIFKNVSKEPLNMPAEELMERFVRGDVSRTGEGSGLGLSIARSLAELQGGSFELSVDGDLFKAEVSLPRAEA